MEKRIILDEQDINEFHEDAAILRWIYDLMTKEYLISEHSKNMPRFFRIINKLKQLQRMRIQTTLNDMLKKHSSHHTFIPDWMHDCARWENCNILIEKFEQKNKQRMKSIFSMFAYWDRVHQFPDGHIKVENNLAWRRKYLHVRSSNKQIPFQRMKEETRKVVVLDWEDKIKLQQFIEDLEQISETYQSPCKELTGINNTIYYLKTIEEAINQRMKLKKIE